MPAASAAAAPVASKTCAVAAVAVAAVHEEHRVAAVRNKMTEEMTPWQSGGRWARVLSEPLKLVQPLMWPHT